MSKEKTGEPNQDLEKKVGVLGRTKYVAAPAAVTVGSYFTPEIKDKYNEMSEEKRTKYKTIALTGTAIFGAIATALSGYKLFKNYKAGKEIEHEQIPESVSAQAE